MALCIAESSEAYLVDELNTRDELSEEWGKPVEDMEMISLNDGNKDHTIQIGSKFDQVIKWCLIFFLQKNANVFV